MFAFSNHVLHKKRAQASTFAQFCNATQCIIGEPNILLFCHFIFVNTPNPITAIIALSTNSATPSTANLFCFGINMFSFFFGEGVTNSGSGIFFCTLSNIISPDCRYEQYSCVLPRCQFGFNNTFTSQCV